MIDIMRQITEILNQKYDEEENKLNAEKEEIIKQIEELSSYINKISENYESINSIDIDKLLNMITPYVDIDKDKVKEDLRIINIIFKGKYEYNLDICLNKDQVHSLEMFIICLQNAKDALNKKKSELLIPSSEINELEELSFDFECLSEMVESTSEPITKEDFRIVRDICNSAYISNDLKIKLLLEIKKYNDALKINVNKTIDIEELKQLLIKECNFNDLDLKLVDKMNALISKKCNINTIKESISLMKELKILGRFEHDRLLVILIYSNPDIIKEKYDKLTTDGNIQYNFFFETPSVWISNERKRRNRVRERKNRKDSSRVDTVTNDAYEISYEEILKNKDFLQSIGYDASYLEYGYKVILKTPNYKLKENYEICKFYGLIDSLDKPNSISVLRTSNLENQINKFIELGLYDYIKKYPSRISVSGDKLFATLYKAKKDHKSKYDEIIFSKFKDGCLSGDVTSGYLGYDLSNLDEFYRMNDRAEMNINNYKEFEDILLSSKEITVDKRILSDSYINKLEIENAGDKYTYKFNNQLISRLKVLRIYDLLTKNPKYNKKDALMFALTYGSIMNQESYDYICGVFGYKEALDELPKKI